MKLSTIIATCIYYLVIIAKELSKNFKIHVQKLSVCSYVIIRTHIEHLYFLSNHLINTFNL